MAAIPQSIRDYLDAIRRFDSEAMLAAFAPDAVVVDERVVYRGLREIRDWIEDAIVVAQPVVTLRLSVEMGDEQRVVADVRGPQLARPLLVTLGFTIVDEHVARLEIRRRERHHEPLEKSRAAWLP